MAGGFSYSSLHGKMLPHNLIIFGIVAGAFMATGLVGIPGIIVELMIWSPCHGISRLRFLGGSELISYIQSGQSGWGDSSIKISDDESLTAGWSNLNLITPIFRELPSQRAADITSR